MKLSITLGVVGIFFLLFLYNKYLYFKEYNDKNYDPTISFKEFVIQYIKRIIQ